MVKDLFIFTHWLKSDSIGQNVSIIKININEFEKSLHKITGKEDFNKENDLEDWEFADHALKYWLEKVKDIQLDKNS